MSRQGNKPGREFSIPQALDLALRCHGAGEPARAESICRRVLQARPDHPEALHLLGVLSLQGGGREQALEFLARAVAVKPDFAEAHNSMGVALRDMGRLDQAAASYGRAVAASPGFAWAHYNLGNLLKDMGRLEQATACFRETLRLRPDFVSAHSNLLLTEHYVSGVTPERLGELHAEWDARHAAPLRGQWPDHANDPDPDRTIRVGLVSPNLRAHPVGWFTIRLLENSPEGMEFVCYSNGRPDHLTERFQRASHGWVDTAAMDDAALAGRILSDRMDILLHLSGHSAGNRLLTFARKPAPVQVSWVGYPGSSGLAAMDFFLSDHVHSPQGEEPMGPERPVRMPHGYVCWDPPPYAPDVGPLPCLDNGFVTLASFNNPAKVNDQVLAAWAAILARVPGSRLVLRYTAMDCGANRGRVAEAMARHGVDASRVVPEGRSGHLDMLARYNQVDLALDTFPYSGGLTTCEALWMGVPVVTFPGRTFAGRHSASHLTNAGLDELVARDAGGYVELAAALAKDQDRLEGLRAGLRQRVASSPLCDGPRFARHFGAAMREIWQEWCRRYRPLKNHAGKAPSKGQG